MAAPTNTQSPPRWWASIWFKLGLSLVLLAVLLYKTDLSELGRAVAKANRWWVIAALAGYIVSQFVSSVRWTMLARALGFREPFGHFFGLYFTGMYMNLFAPSTVAGDIGRALFLGGQKRKALAFTTVIADRGLGFVVLSWIGAIAIFTQPGYRLPAPLYYGAWTIPPGTLLAWLFGPRLVARLLPPGNRWRTLLEHDLAPYWRDYRLLIETSLVAVVFHTIQVLTQVFLAWALKMKTEVWFFFIFVPVVNILGMLPISFSGIGIREFFYLFFLHKIGVARHTAVALGLLSSVVVLITGLTGGLVFLLWKVPAPSAEVSAPAEGAAAAPDSEPARAIAQNFD
ncbi:MAG: lysylphosphatidylglycerol synthase transmembrane domain-containing protein [Candidatus Binatia bacterium]|jgi:glycosyltransferase 2 family protein